MYFILNTAKMKIAIRIFKWLRSCSLDYFYLFNDEIR